MWVQMRRAFASLSFALLAGCSGASLPPATGPSSGPSVAKVRATIRIVIPKRTRRSRGARYISPATQSIAIAVTPSGGGAVQRFNADLTPATNPDCTTSAICTLHLNLFPGSYTATFATYDGPLSGGNAPGNPPTGHALSANQSVPLSVATGKKNEISATLSGIPFSVAFVPWSDSTMSGSPAEGFSISKCLTSGRVSVFGVDADGNYILGPGAPSVGLASSDPSHLAATPPTASSPNTFVMTRPAIPNAGVSLQLTASATPLASSGGTSPVDSSFSVTFNGAICGVLTEFAIPTAASYPAGIASGPDGELWFTELGTSKIGRISTDGTIAEKATVTAASGPVGITAGPDGNLWFTECIANKIGRINTAGMTVTEFSSSLTPSSEPEYITAGPDGALWFTETAGNNIGRITTLGAISEFSIPTTASGAVGIATGADGALWFTECAANKLGRVTTGGGFAEFSIPTLGSQPVAITAGPNGQLWLTEAGANQIGRSPTAGSPIAETLIPTAGTSPNGITAGPDGAVWFTETNRNKIGRITTAGTITETPISSPSEPLNITTGPDGALWFTEFVGNKIGRLQ